MSHWEKENTMLWKMLHDTNRWMKTKKIKSIVMAIRAPPSLLPRPWPSNVQMSLSKGATFSKPRTELTEDLSRSSSMVVIATTSQVKNYAPRYISSTNGTPAHIKSNGWAIVALSRSNSPSTYLMVLKTVTSLGRVESAIGSATGDRTQGIYPGLGPGGRSNTLLLL